MIAVIFEVWRIAGVIRDYGMNNRAEAPEDSKVVHAAN